ncbi:MAG TPA: UbiA family prenyltransferase, partial [Candidatus Acidoferrum sp.]|nr:UbiA family prenyltransferase [Candidatus Acidoferrum sp.]
MPVARPGLGRRLYGLLRLAHPFPSALNAAITAVVAGYAGGATDVIVRLALAMLAIQVSIGATNDVVDTPADRIAKPTKPIPGGLVPAGLAVIVAAVGFSIGLGLAASVSIPALFLALGGCAAGLAYDLRLKGTAASWLPFAVGIPLMPLFAWVGATGEVPGPILLLAGLAVPSGAAIALANALPDIERDTASGVRTVATALGRARGVGVLAALQALVVVGA